MCMRHVSSQVGSAVFQCHGHMVTHSHPTPTHPHTHTTTPSQHHTGTPAKCYMHIYCARGRNNAAQTHANNGSYVTHNTNKHNHTPTTGAIWHIPRTRSSITWAKISMTRTFPSPASSLVARARIKSPARTHSFSLNSTFTAGILRRVVACSTPIAPQYPPTHTHTHTGSQPGCTATPHFVSTTCTPLTGQSKRLHVPH